MAKIWSCDVRTLPATIQGDPPVPTVGVLWTCDGYAMNISVFEGTSVSELQLRQSFEETTTRPAAALHGRPQRIRVASSALARRLREVVPKIPVDVQSTPDIDDAFDSLVESLSGPRLSPLDEFMELEDSVRGELMPAALGLFELHPWEVFPADVPVESSFPAANWPTGTC